MTNRILIIGASGFIGNTIYKELRPYFDVYGTYCTQEETFSDNQVFYAFNAENDTIVEILKEVQPDVIISCFKATADKHIQTHKLLCDYVWASNTKLLFVSSASVFDAKNKFPAYEHDVPSSQSNDGKQKIAVEKLIQHLPELNYLIVRLPLILGVNSPSIIQLKQAIKHHASFEVFPNIVVSASTADKVAQQIHYLVNKQLAGIFHLASNDVSHHDDLFKEISEKLSEKKPIFTNAYQSNDDEYLAILSKENLLPKNYQITLAEIIADSSLQEEIITLKNSI